MNINPISSVLPSNIKFTTYKDPTVDISKHAPKEDAKQIRDLANELNSIKFQTEQIKELGHVIEQPDYYSTNSSKKNPY